MSNIELHKLFHIVPGISSSNVKRIKHKISDIYIPYIRPSHRQNSSIDAYVNKCLVPKEKVFPANTLYVSTDGQGSHTYAYVSACEFVPNSNVAVLIPKKEMKLQEKLYYALCITQNRYKFSYGRKPKGARLEKIMLPFNVPEAILDYSIRSVGNNLLNAINFPCVANTYKENNNIVPLSKLFVVHNGLASSGLSRAKYKIDANWISYIRPSFKQETSIDGYVDSLIIPSNKIFQSGMLYVSTNGQGSHTYAYVSACEFVPNSDVSVLVPKREMSLQEKLFYAYCITNNRYKFSYGRKPKGDRLKAIMLPEYPPEKVLKYNIDSVVTAFNNSLNNI